MATRESLRAQGLWDELNDRPLTRTRTPSNEASGVSDAVVERGWSAWIEADNSGQDEHSCFVAGLTAAIAAIPPEGRVEEAAELARVGREHLLAGNIDDALTAFARIRTALQGDQQPPSQEPK